MRIVVDAFGGDHAPLAPIQGARLAKDAYGAEITLVGKEEEIRACAVKNGIDLTGLDIEPAPDVFSMHTDPTELIKSGKNSSLALACQMVAEGSMYNLVGFQTNLKFGEQKWVFSMIPGLQNAEFLRYGVMHRNSFLNSPALLAPTLYLKREPRVYFAGQITGMEGYMESAAGGLIAGINAANTLLGRPAFLPPDYTMLGALCRYVAGSTSKDFQPMGANFGILPALETKIKDKRARYMALAQRAMEFYRMEE